MITRKRIKKSKKSQSLRQSVARISNVPNHEVCEAKFRFVQTISGAATTGTVNTALILSTILTGLPDYSDMQAVFKRIACPMVKIRITPVDVNQTGVLAFGFDPDSNTAPGTFNKVAELKYFSELRSVEPFKTLTIINPNLTFNKMPFMLVDTSNLTALSSIKLYQDAIAANASKILYYVTLTYYTYWSYRG